MTEPANLRIIADQPLSELCLIRFHDGIFRVYTGEGIVFRVRIDTTPEQRFADLGYGRFGGIRHASVSEICTLLRHLDWPYQVLPHMPQPCAVEKRAMIIR